MVSIEGAIKESRVILYFSQDFVQELEGLDWTPKGHVGLHVFSLMHQA